MGGFPDLSGKSSRSCQFLLGDKTNPHSYSPTAPIAVTVGLRATF
jgi:hypothetical protein